VDARQVVLPEPVPASELGSPHDTVALAESLSVAFLVLVQRLSPVERAVFLLHDVFEHDYEEIGQVVGKSAATCRQIARRAKRRLGERRVRFRASDEEVRAAIHRFAQAAQRGDTDGMRALLDPAVTLHTDGGDERPSYGRVRARSRPLHGADAVARFLLGVQAQAPEGMRYEVLEANGAPALHAFRADRLIAVMSFDVDYGRIRDIFLVVDPPKLACASRHRAGTS
jgi:RNA polymerase sigma-70 factor (ECF subfamily)